MEKKIMNQSKHLDLWIACVNVNHNEKEINVLVSDSV